jgi:conjugative transposon TraN protein
VDRGSAALLAQKAKGTENILQVKAGKQGFPQTNLSVVTADGKLYSFIVDYAPEPSVLNVSFLKETETGNQVELAGESLNEAELVRIGKQVNEQRDFLRVATKEQKMVLQLKGIYLSGSSMWLTLKLFNTSLIDYKPDYVCFFLRDRKRAKRTAVQETEMFPLLPPCKEVVPGNASMKLLFPFRPFTIPRSKELVIQIGEQNGGRSLVLPVSYKKILKARLVKDIQSEN